MFKVFAFDFETCVKTILPLINRLIKFCWLLTAVQSDVDTALYWRPALVSDKHDKHVPACRFQSVSPGAGALVWFSCSQGWKWMVHITVMSCCSNSCCHASVLSSCWRLTFQHTTRAQEDWAAATQDSGLHTRHVAHQQTRSQSCRLQNVDIDSEMSSSETTRTLNIVDELWLLTEWHIIFGKEG